MRFAPSLSTCFAFAAGVATVFGFAPFRAPVVPLVTLALLLVLWQGALRPRAAARLGFAFGVGLFGTGVSWVYVAIHTFGGMPAPLAAIGTAVFVAYVALFPAAAGCYRRAFHRPADVAARGGRRRRVDVPGVDPQLALLRLRLALARLQPAARKPARGLRSDRRRVRGDARGRAGGGGACAHDRRLRRRRDAPRIRVRRRDRRVGGRRHARSRASSGPRRRVRRSPCPSSRATSRRTSSSIPAFASAPTISTRGSPPPRAAA